jgi:hypothetical protein
MLLRTSKSPFTAVLFCLAFGFAWLHTTTASAEEMIIRRPGDHPTYSVELEPHGVFAFVAPIAGTNGFGLGGRATIPLVKNGFIGSINNNVGIGFGLDWMHYNGCYYWRNANGDCANLETLWVPVVMQWNFFLSTHWSVFGEPGLALRYSSWGQGCTGGPVTVNGQVVACGEAPNHLVFDPFVFFVGGRYHFSEKASLTMRIGWPYASVGVSFFP